MYTAKIGYKSQTPEGEWVGNTQGFGRAPFPSVRAAAFAMGKWLTSESDNALERVVTQSAGLALIKVMFSAAASLAEEMGENAQGLASGGLRTCTAGEVDDEGREHIVQYEIRGA